MSSMSSNGLLNADDVVRVILALYSTLSFKPPPRQFTILAAFALSDPETSITKIISLGTGSKCLPGIRLCAEGDALHDSHAEIIARRGAMRWLMEEVARIHYLADDAGNYSWLRKLPDGKFALRDGVRLVLYVSTVPCGDASTRYLASFQDAEMAALKDATPFEMLPFGAASRGRDRYSLYGVLRTKPGRADSLPTLSMSCSDKIASWNVVGIQGALGTAFLHPVYINDIVVGEVAPSLQDLVQEDCKRAFWSRLAGRLDNIPAHYHVHQPTVHFTASAFMHSRMAIEASHPVTSCNESLCWIADSVKMHEVLINGVKRGISPKNQHNPKFRPLLAKVSFFNLYQRLLHCVARDGGRVINMTAAYEGKHPSQKFTYWDAKQAMTEYQSCKDTLQGPQGPFCGWVKSGAQWERFHQDGRCDVPVFATFQDSTLQVASSYRRLYHLGMPDDFISTTSTRLAGRMQESELKIHVQSTQLSRDIRKNDKVKPIFEYPEVAKFFKMNGVILCH